MTAIPHVFNRLFSLEGKVALITGASGGIGSALAIGFAEAGAAIAVHGRDVTRVEETCHAIETVGGRALPLIADLNNVQECRDLVARTHRELGRLDILINNAATNRRKPILEVTEDDYEVITGVNTRAIFFLSQAAHRPMRDQGSGKIIHIASINVSFALDTVSVYGLSKGAVAQMT
jgi:2-deoxy-D-gluconate 3-dehydrogenase